MARRVEATEGAHFADQGTTHWDFMGSLAHGMSEPADSTEKRWPEKACPISGWQWHN